MGTGVTPLVEGGQIIIFRLVAGQPLVEGGQIIIFRLGAGHRGLSGRMRTLYLLPSRRSVPVDQMNRLLGMSCRSALCMIIRG